MELTQNPSQEMREAETVKLSRVERIIISQQAKILERLYPDEAEYWREVQTVMERGYEMHYEWVFDHVYPDTQTMSEEESREVLDILEMFTALKRSYEKLEDKAGIDASLIEFPGFDGNTEAKYMAYAEFFCGLDGGRFKELNRGDNFNSHAPFLEKYRRMLSVWRRARDRYALTKDEIIKITSA